MGKMYIDKKAVINSEYEDLELWEEWDEWEDIYDFESYDNIAEFEKCHKKNEKLYNNLSFDKSKVMNDCLKEAVDHAIKYNNHAAFAKIFFMIKTYEEKLENIKKTFEMCIKDEDFLVIDEHYWEDVSFDIPVDANGKINREDINEKKYSQNRTGIDSILKSEIVQLAVLLGWNVKETNDVLMSLGLDSLYPLNIIEAVEIRYLDDFANDKSKGYDEKIILLKKDINKYIKRYLLGDENKEFFYIDKIYKKNNDNPMKKRTLVQRRNIKKNMEGSLGREVAENIQLYNSHIGASNINENDEFALSKELTQYFLKELDEVDDTLTTYFDKTKLTDDKTIITQGRLGLGNIVLSFLNHSERYEKNLISNEAELTRYEPYKYEYIVERIEEAKKEYENAKKYKKDENKLDYEQELEHYNDFFVSQECREFYEDRSIYLTDNLVRLGKKKKVINDIIKNRTNDQSRSGRDILDIILVGKRLKGTDYAGYTYKIKKQHLISYAIATGNEDRIRELMAIAGFSYIDLYSDNKDINIDNLMLDHYDAIVSYALLYRDRIIDEWCKNERMSNRKRYKDSFPFISLLRYIARDIQYASIIEDKKINLDYLLFPIRKSPKNKTDIAKVEEDRIWYKEYLKRKE